jgi:hypothetical protein
MSRFSAKERDGGREIVGETGSNVVLCSWASSMARRSSRSARELARDFSIRRVRSGTRSGRDNRPVCQCAIGRRKAPCSRIFFCVCVYEIVDNCQRILSLNEQSFMIRDVAEARPSRSGTSSALGSPGAVSPVRCRRCSARRRRGAVASRATESRAGKPDLLTLRPARRSAAPRPRRRGSRRASAGRRSRPRAARRSPSRTA